MIRILYLIGIFLMLACANQTSPTGGPKDKKAPALIESNPENNQKNFKGKTIELTFDENVVLNNANEEIIISPSTGKKTKYAAKGRKVIITPEQALSENTTYSINFREGIKDITEGNKADSLQLAFSTGPSIDSLQISGSVYDMISSKPLEKITVAVYAKDTFDIFRHAPSYFTFSDKKGNFTLRNLKTQTYWIYAFEDKNKNLKIESKSEKFGFVSRAILANDTSRIKIGLVKLDSRPIKITSVRHTEKLTSVRINKEIISAQVTNPKSGQSYQYGTKKDEFLIHHNLTKETDSLNLKLFLQDSLQQTYDTTIYIKGSTQKYVDEQFRISNQRSLYQPETKHLSYTLKTNKLLKLINPDSIYIKYDSGLVVPISPRQLKYDTLDNVIRLEISITDSLITKNSAFHLAPASFISYKNDTTKRSTFPLKIPKPEETSTIEIFVSTQEPNYIIQLIKEDGTIIQETINPKQHVFKYLDPLTYKIRIIYDENGNKQWDAGNFQKRLEPEKIIYYKNSENQTTIPTRANWEVGPLSITF